MSLEGLLEAKRLRKEPTSNDEIKALLGIVERSLRDAAVETISEDLRFIAAYNALLTSATAALRAAGYRTGAQGGHHELTFETLQFTIGAEGAFIRKLKAFATQRGKATYDFAGSVSDEQLRGAIRAAEELKTIVVGWIRKNHGQLLPD